jgi:PAS domain-containing protein
VVTLFDITSLRDKDVELRSALATSDALMDSLREPVLLLDEELRVVTANRAFFEKFGVPAVHAAGVLLYDLQNKAWDVPAMRTLLEKTLPERKRFVDVPVELELPGVGRRTLRIEGRRLETGPGTGIILIFRDPDEHAA